MTCSRTIEFEKDVALCPPPQRMVCVVVGYDAQRDHWFTDFKPVVAIRTCNRLTMVNNVAGGDYPANVEQAIDSDWFADYKWFAETEALVLDEVYDIVNYADVACSNTITTLEMCPWPMEDDTEKLANVVDDLKVELARKLRIDKDAK